MFFLLLASHLLASGSFPHWQDNPEGILSGKLSSPPHLPERTHEGREILWEALFTVSCAFVLKRD